MEPEHWRFSSAAARQNLFDRIHTSLRSGLPDGIRRSISSQFDRFLSRPLDIASMCDGDNRDALRRTVDLVDHAEVTSTSAVQTAHFEPKGFANSVRVLGKSAIDELDARSRGLLWKSIEGTQGACGPIDVVHVERYR